MPYTPLSSRTVIDVPEYPSSSPSTAPRFTKHRSIVGAIDTGNITNKKSGMNMSGFDNAIIRVIPDNGANPSIEVLFWSEEAGKFISDSTGLTVAAKGADVSYDFKCEVNDRIIFVYVTGTVTGDDTVEVLIAGDNQNG